MVLLIRNFLRPVCFTSLVICTLLLTVQSSTLHAMGCFRYLGRTLYVAVSGNDKWDGSLAKPWRNIQIAANNSRPGDTILIGDGDYAGGIIDLNHPGLPGLPITFLAAHKGKAIIHGNQTTNIDGFLVMKSDFVIVDGLVVISSHRAGIRVDRANSVTVRNCLCTGNRTWGIFTDYSDDTLIENNECSFSRMQHGIYVSNSGDRPIVRFNLCHDNARAGIQLNGDGKQLMPILGTRGDGIIMNGEVSSNVIYNCGKDPNNAAAAINLACVQNSLIANNLVYNSLGSGIALWNDNTADATQWGSKNNRIYQNTVYFKSGTGRWCLTLKNGSTDNVVMNNIFSGGARGAFEIDNTSSMQSDYNLLYSLDVAYIAIRADLQTTYLFGDWQQLSGNDLHSINSNPLFVRSTGTGLDYRLKPSSPALKTGTPIPDILFDLTGNPRPSGGGWDMGCYQQ